MNTSTRRYCAALLLALALAGCGGKFVYKPDDPVRSSMDSSRFVAG